MLPAHIIEELLRRERQRHDLQRPQPELRLPLPESPVRHEPPRPEHRGVLIIPIVDCGRGGHQSTMSKVPSTW